jgi:N6-L-threonylcarbamoyladenine synthase
MIVLGIETSCDETGIALLEAAGGVRAPKLEVIKNVVSSQIPIHRPFGGVVPNLAKREHLKNLPIVYRRIFSDKKSAEFLWKKIGLIAVTVGPGLEPALWTGIEFAKRLAEERKKPLVGANHLEGHLYSFLLPGQMKTVKIETDSRLRGSDRSDEAGDRADGGRNDRLIFPMIALIVSGGHTLLLRMESFSKWKQLGETRDDAAGEAFDKVARLLALPYPGGPEIEKLAKSGDPNAIAFPRPMIHDHNFDFSFSGLKTSVLYYFRDNPGANKADIAASFQQAAIDVLIAKAIRAAERFGAKSVILCGGVAANQALRFATQRACKDRGQQCFVPPFAYNIDNAAMIAAAGYMDHGRKKKYPLRANGNLGI